MNRILTTTCILGLLVSPSLAQNGSLRKAGQTLPQQLAQPATAAPQAREIILPAPGQASRPLIPGQTQQPILNPALLQMSLTAVEPPQPLVVQPHDLVTIIIREDKLAISDSRLQNDKSWELESRLREFFRFTNGRIVPVPFSNGEPGIDFEFEDNYEGQGRANRRDQLITRLTAEVIDVKPNGVLTIQARKTISMDEDVQIMTLTGQIRSDDIDTGNTVLSTQIANAEINVQHTGPTRDSTRRGWLKRGLDLLRPF